MTARIGVGPKYRLSSEVGAPRISTKISPFGSLPQPLHAAILRPRSSTGRARAMVRPLIETAPSHSHTVCPATAAIRFRSGTPRGR